MKQQLEKTKCGDCGSKQLEINEQRTTVVCKKCGWRRVSLIGKPTI